MGILDAMNQETNAHEPGRKMFRGDNKDYEGSNTNSESTNIDKDDLGLESGSGREYDEDDLRIKNEQIKKGGMGSKKDFVEEGFSYEESPLANMGSNDEAIEIKKLMERLQYHTQKQANYEMRILHIMKEAAKGYSQADGPVGSRGY